MYRPFGHTPTSGRPKPAATVRIALWSARHRWLVLMLWLVAVLGLFSANSMLGGTRIANMMGSDQAKTEAEKGYAAFSDAGSREQGEKVWLVLGATSGSIGDAAHRAEVVSVVGTLQAATARIDGQPTAVPVFDSVVNPFDAPPQAGLVSADGTSAMVTGVVGGADVDIEAKIAALQPTIDSLGTDHPDLRVMALSNTIVNKEAGDLAIRDMDGSLRLTIPITFLILLLAFGAVIAALVPLALAVTALIGTMGLVGLYSRFVEPSNQYAGQVIILIGLAVAVDYSLFMISRFRSERQAGRDTYAAIEVASSTAGRAVFFSGLAVAISLSGLLIMDNAIFRAIATGTISVVLVSVVGSFTFLPAVLAILGRRIDWLSIPFLGSTANRPSVWSRIVRFATDRPAIVALAVAAFLLVGGSPVTRLGLGVTGIDGLPSDLKSVQAWQYMESKWPQGSVLTLETFVTGADRPATQAAIRQYASALSAVPGIGQAAGVRTSGDGTVADVIYTLPGNSNDKANWDLVRKVRSGVVPAAFGSVPGTHVYVSGDAANALDQTDLSGGQTPMVIAFVLGLSFLLLLVAFHSIVIPIEALLLNLLSAGAAFGALQLVFQEGWFKDVLGITPSPIEAWIPPMIFTILFGLSMDYHVFILTRVKEGRDRGLSSVDAVVKGISVTSGTITSAAAIMVAVFAVFVSLHFSMIREMGLGLAVAVFVDATLVRSLLLPSTMKLLGDWNWYMPPFLRWLPRITIEGEREFALDESIDEEPVEAAA